MTRKEALTLLQLERFHQDNNHPEGVIDHQTAINLLIEELGEFAADINDGHYDRAKNELVQLAALAVRTLEELYD